MEAPSRIDHQNPQVFHIPEHSNPFLKLESELIKYLLKFAGPSSQHVLPLVCKKFHALVGKGAPIKPQAYESAALIGSLALFEFFDAKLHCPLPHRIRFHAARSQKDDPNLLEWLSKRLSESDGIEGGVCYAAAERGNIQILKWARLKGYAWDYHTPSYAARGGHLELLKWAIDEGCPREWDAIVGNAAEHGHFEIVKWCHELGVGRYASATARASKGGHLHILQWLRAHDYKWDERAAQLAANYVHLELLDWALANGAPYEQNELIAAVKFAQLSLKSSKKTLPSTSLLESLLPP